MKRKTNENGITAIYVRRSVADRDNNSLSILFASRNSVIILSKARLRDLLRVLSSLQSNPTLISLSFFFILSRAEIFLTSYRL